MQQNKFGEIIFNETDVCDLLMQGRSIESLKGMLVDSSVDIEKVVAFVEHFPNTLVHYKFDATKIQNNHHHSKIVKKHCIQTM